MGLIIAYKHNGCKIHTKMPLACGRAEKHAAMSSLMAYPEQETPGNMAAVDRPLCASRFRRLVWKPIERVFPASTLAYPCMKNKTPSRCRLDRPVEQ